MPASNPAIRHPIKSRTPPTPQAIRVEKGGGWFLIQLHLQSHRLLRNIFKNMISKMKFTINEKSTIAKRPILHLTKCIEIPRNIRAGVVKNYSTRLAKLAFSRVMNNILTRPNIGDRQCRSWHRFILSHPQKTGTDRDSSTRQSVSPNICLFRPPSWVWMSTHKGKDKLFIIPDGFIYTRAAQWMRNFIAFSADRQHKLD
jgi:hypothetical protein